MRRLALLVIFIQNAVISMAYADTATQVVKVADPFLEMHTGPSPGYPITNVVKRDETISIIKRRTTWYLIKNNKDFEGWVHRSQLVKTLTLDDEKIAVQLEQAKANLEKLDSPYCKSYYAGVIFERRAKHHLKQGGPGAAGGRVGRAGAHGRAPGLRPALQRRRVLILAR